MKRAAFTLIELLVVIVIIGILSAISVAAFSNYQDKARLAKAQSFAAQANKFLLAETRGQSLDPVVHWKFNKGSGTNFTDFSGSGNDFNCTNTSFWEWNTDHPFGDGGNSVEINSYLCTDLTGINNAPIESYIMSIWFKPDGFTVGQKGAFFSFNTQHFFRTNLDETVDFVHRSGVINSTKIIKANRWHHLLGTYDGANMSFYVDGVLVGTQANAEATNLSNMVYFSYNNSGPLVHGNYRGLVSDAILYPVAYTP